MEVNIQKTYNSLKKQENIYHEGHEDHKVKSFFDLNFKTSCPYALHGKKSFVFLYASLAKRAWQGMMANMKEFPYHIEI